MFELWRKMKMSSSFIVFLLIFNDAFKLSAQGRSGILVKKFQHCDPNAKYDQMYNLTFKTVDNKQYLDGLVTMKKPMDNSMRLNISVETLIGKNYVYLLSINERKACDAMHKFLGEFMYNLERRAQLIPGICPLAEGRHHLHNVLLDYKQVTIAENFPFGNLRITLAVFDKNNNIYSCIIVEVEHNF